MASADLRDELNCSICLDVYTDPVTLGCGHNFCRDCIDDVLESQSNQGVFTCPQCRMQFMQRPLLQKNVTLANIVERFRSAPPSPKQSGIFCTYCIHTAVPAVKSCLHCEAVLCDDHLRVHSKSPEHVLTELSTSLEVKKCSVHKKVLEYYCMVDCSVICVSCMQEQKHRGHAVQEINDASRYKMDRLKSGLMHLTSRRQVNEKQVQNLQENKKKASDMAAQVVNRVASMFLEIREKLDALEIQTTNNITQQVEENSREVTDLIQQLDMKNDELSSKICHIEELCKVTDPMTILQECESNRADFFVTEKGGWKAVPVIAHLDEVLISLKLQRDLSEILSGVPSALVIPELSNLSFDRHTAASNVAVSRDMAIAHGTHVDSDVEDTDDRFDSHQVLSRQGLSFGRHYWEVELCDTNTWRIGMAYDSVERFGNNAVFGNTEESWCLCKSQQGYSFRHDGNQVFLPGPYGKFKRLGIYLDYEAGRLSFYNLGLEVSHLHTFYADFTEPLFAAIRLGYGVWVKVIT